MHLAIVLTLMPLAQTPDTPSEGFLCYREFRAERGDLTGLAKMVVDKDHQPVSALLTVSGHGFDAEWGATLKEGAVRLVPLRFDIDAWPLPRGTRFPIEIDVSIDGRRVGRFPFQSETVQIVDPARYRQARGTPTDKLAVAASPAVKLPAFSRPEHLWGAATIVLAIRDASGAILDRRPLETPNWRQLRSFADAAFPAIEAERRSGNCRRFYDVPATD